ncbi:sigma-70 family RNA polymerase sigma factor [Kitasatospora sp. NPDC048194]|uniref:BACON domain-containing protein n=1 Tax=Kitasatospora sp. NPDC048194 TaxID=3364045 RepID=UPI0037137630
MTTRTVGAVGAVPGPRAAAVSAEYDRQVDGLFTYCLSVLCEHDAATDALREVGELARRHGGRLTEPGLVRAWLFSLARYCCLRRLADGTAREPGTEPTEAEAARRRRELASLAWPEAAGTDPEQREALELSVRHRLTPLEVAAVLGLPFDRTRELLATAEAEVARTRAALLVLGVGSCPELDRLGGAGAESWRDWVLGPALRRELVQHVVDCPTCRGTAERVAAGEAAEGAAGAGAGLSGLPLLAAPAPGAAGSSVAADPAGTADPAGPSGSSGPSGTGGSVGGVAYLPSSRAAERRGAVPAEPGLRFDHSGFPRHRAPDAGRGLAVRRRVVTTGVLAAVLAAPVVALWAGHRGGGGPGSAASVSAVRVDEAGQEAGQRPPQPWAAGVPAEAVSGAGMPGLELAGAGAGGAGGAETLLPGFPRLTFQGPLVPVPSRGATPLSSPTLVAAPAPGADRATNPGAGPADPAGLLTVEAAEYGSRTVLTLTNSGATEIRWRAVTDAGWLRLSREAGTLAPGQRITVIVTVDEDLAPATHWTARIALPPSQAVVTLEGGPQNRGGSASSSGEPSSTPGSSAPPTPSAPASATSSPSASPSTSASPSGAGPTSPPPSATGSPSSQPSHSGTPTGTPSPSAPPAGTPSPHPTGTAPAQPSGH